MKKAPLTIFLAVACMTSLLFAQAPPTHTPPNPATIAEHRVHFLTTLLSLTSDQQSTALGIFTNEAASAAPLYQQLKTARQSLAAAVKSNNSGAITTASTNIGTLTGQLAANKATADAAFYQLLHLDQQNKLTQFEKQRHGRGFRGMGPGMM